MTFSATMLGRIGQTALEAWAAQANITANPSYHDERGWDALLQISPAGVRGPLDQAPPETSCMVQVKTTMTDKTSEPLALSNWWRMCTDPVPWFVLVVHVDEDLKPDGAHLVHIGEEWCAAVLRRMRELGDAERERLHKHSIAVTWSDAERLSELHGRELLRRLRVHVGLDQHAYVQRKMAWYRDVGYEDRARRIKLSVPVEDPVEFWRNFADLGAGVRSTVPGEWSGKVTDVRFGIEATLHELHSDMGDMELCPPSQGNVTLQLVSGVAEAPPLTCSLFRASAVFPFIPTEYDKMRLASAYMTCVFTNVFEAGCSGVAADFSFQLPGDEPVELRDLASILATLQVLADHGAHPLTARLGAAGYTIDLKPRTIGSFEAEQLEFIKTLACAVRICEWFAVPGTTKLLVPELLAQREAVLFMGTVRRGEDGDIGPLQAPYREAVPIGEHFAATTECAVHLPDRMLACVVAVQGPVTGCEEVPDVGARIHVQQGSVIVEKLVVMGDEATDDVFEAPRAEVRRRVRDLGCNHISDHLDVTTRRQSVPV